MPSDSPTMWVSAEPISDPALWWTRYQQRQEATGLRPVVCCPNAATRPLDPAEIAAVDLERVLERDWHVYREQQLERLAAPPVAAPLPPEVAEFIEPFEDDPGAPFDRWPGLAPAADRAVDDPDKVARRVFAQWAADNPDQVSRCHLALVAADRSADIPAVMGWDADAPLALLCSLLRSWEDRFGARVLAAVGSTVHVSVAHPPRTGEQALHIALEHVLTTADNVIKDPPTPYPDYAASLIDNNLWSFWWD
ncbi:DUF4253 domain-containing protein [Streptomyces violascens]|uniref:DUF4253 domain-containing protein n=1 Tax=Streptomyces violascens TaxID=67381 RepID=UPI00365F177D